MPDMTTETRWLRSLYVGVNNSRVPKQIHKGPHYQRRRSRRSSRRADARREWYCRAGMSDISALFKEGELSPDMYLDNGVRNSGTGDNGVRAHHPVGVLLRSSKSKGCPYQHQHLHRVGDLETWKSVSTSHTVDPTGILTHLEGSR
jgi:hypothetical protein